MKKIKRFSGLFQPINSNKNKLYNVDIVLPAKIIGDILNEIVAKEPNIKSTALTDFLASYEELIKQIKEHAKFSTIADKAEIFKNNLTRYFDGIESCQPSPAAIKAIKSIFDECCSLKDEQVINPTAFYDFCRENKKIEDYQLDKSLPIRVPGIITFEISRDDYKSLKNHLEDWAKKLVVDESQSLILKFKSETSKALFPNASGQEEEKLTFSTFVSTLFNQYTQYDQMGKIVTLPTPQNATDLWNNIKLITIGETKKIDDLKKRFPTEVGYEKFMNSFKINEKILFSKLQPLRDKLKLLEKQSQSFEETKSTNVHSM